jgi:hypothetical protein
MAILPFNTEQAARGFLMHQLALRGYLVQMTDSRFPTEDMLVVSPEGKHFGIDVKGQQTESFWQYSHKKPHPDRYYAFVFVSLKKPSRIFLMTSEEAMHRWKDYHDAAIARGTSEENRWGKNRKGQTYSFAFRRTGRAGATSPAPAGGVAPAVLCPVTCTAS